MKRNLTWPKWFIFFLLLLSCAEMSFAVTSNAARELQNNFISVAKELKPSVVNIRVEKSEEGNGNAQLFGTPFDQLPDGSPFDDLIKKFFKEYPKGKRFKSPKSPFKSEAAGSGVILDSKGIILTNNHVVKGATNIMVKLSDGKELKAKVVGKDPQSDLAIIKVEPTSPLQAAKFADSDKVEVGQWAIAIGNPMGLEQTVTIGVVSAVGRSGIGASPIEDFIQTDAGINPGNSGGPLVDLDGNVIGINTLIYAAPGAGIGFAIPSNIAKRVANQISEKGSVERPYMGITMAPITPELAEHFNLPDKNGTVIMELNPNTPAEKAGLKQMDIIRGVDGHEMATSNEVQKYVLNKNVGETINLKILRNGTEKEIPVKLERMPKSFGLRDPEDVEETEESKGGEKEIPPKEKLGFSFKSITPELKKSLKIDKEKQGLVVTEIEENSPAEKGGLIEQDVITQVNGQAVSDEDSLKKALRAGNPTKKSSVFVVLREGTPMFLVIPEKTDEKK
ncbi:MAG: Do family serine endopeptidase [Candidatus Riflebacteria bacterium]|nr:Do family serine endopeptidase [Candidatus Riflebacteria bacterium]